MTCVGPRLGGMMVVPGQCGPFLDVGQVCDPSSEFPGCPSSAPRSPTTGTCQAKPEPTVGDACQKFTDCVRWDAAMYCNSDNKCAKQGGVGDACDPAVPYCVWSSCDATTKVCIIGCK